MIAIIALSVVALILFSLVVIADKSDEKIEAMHDGKHCVECGKEFEDNEDFNQTLEGPVCDDCFAIDLEYEEDQEGEDTLSS